jgi:hypothetical protein
MRMLLLMQDVDGSGDLSLSEVTEFLQQRGFVASAEEVEGAQQEIQAVFWIQILDQTCGDYQGKLRTACLLCKGMMPVVS